MTDEHKKHYEKRYNEWAGNPKGTAPDYDRCAESVYDGTSGLFYQCSRKRSTGPDNAYCWQHAKKHRPRPQVVETTGAAKRVFQSFYSLGNSLPECSDCGTNEFVVEVGPDTMGREFRCGKCKAQWVQST